MSSMVTRGLYCLLLLTAPAASSADLAQGPAPLATAPLYATTQSYATLSPAIAQWNALRQTDALPFESYATFLVAHPGWPGEAAMRRTAEKAIVPGATAPTQVAAFFDKFPPLTNQGQARYAEALLQVGRRADALPAARKAWTSGSLSTIDEARVIGLFGASFTPADQDERMDRLLWAGLTTAAQRQILLTSPARRALFDTRLALRMKAPDAAMRATAVSAQGATDAGFIADKAIWLRSTMQLPAMRQLLAQPRQLTVRPSEVEKWYELLLSTARAAVADRQYDVAYNIARQVDDAYAPGTDIRDRPIGERDDYTSLVWLAGSTALNQRGRPADAIALFDRYARAAKSPQTQSKGHYWAGRAAQSASRAAEASGHFEQAAHHSEQFYGQLALERLGRPVPAPGTAGAIQVTAADRIAFNNREIVRAARYLGQTGQWQDQTQFVRAISASVETDKDHVLAGELAQGIGRPDLAVMVGRVALSSGASDYVRTGFPNVRVPPAHEAWTTMIHAIARQESQFDRAAISHAGARGLMQLMPATARETATKIGLGYDANALTTDIGYNIQLGSTYFQRMLSYYGGSYPLAVAAYNAGPGNVNKWLKANGDPRLPGGDIVRWIEDIPIYETKNYVQRVLENAVVYDRLNPARAQVQTATPLSRYLGKSSRG